MEIKKADLKDAEKILDIQKSAYLSEAKRYNDFGIAPLRQTLEEIEKEFSSHVILKAMAQSSLVGSVRARALEDTCHIGRLIVLPDYQGRGIGGSLLREIEKYFPGIKRFELFTGDRSMGNLRLYEKHGYKQYKSEFLNNNITLVFMEKKP